MTRSWLVPVAAALDAADRPCPIFFRDDDAGWDDSALLELLGTFERAGVVVDVAVIPTALSAPLAAQLAPRADAGIVRLHQHGYAHLDHETTGRACEFGASRDLEAQGRDIAAGRALLLDLLDEVLVDPVFTPPWNRCSEATADALLAQGFDVLSRDATAVPFERPELAEVPVHVDWSGTRKGVPLTLGDVAERLVAGIGAGGPVGVMLHHAVLDGAGRRAVEELLALVGGHPSAMTTTIMEVAGGSRCTESDGEA